MTSGRTRDPARREFRATYHEAVANSDLPQGCRAVLWEIAWHADPDGGNAYPSLERLARRCVISARQVRRHIALAVARGWLTVRRQRRKPNVYALTIPTETGHQGPASEEARADTHVRSSNVKTGHLGCQDRTSGAVKSGHPCPPTTQLPRQHDHPPVAARPPLDTAQTLIGEHVAACRARPPERVLGQLAKLTKELLAQGQPVDAVRAGLSIVRDRCLHPATLPAAVNEALNPGSRRPGVTDVAARHAREDAILADFLARNSGPANGHRVIIGEVIR